MKTVEKGAILVVKVRIIGLHLLYNESTRNRENLKIKRKEGVKMLHYTEFCISHMEVTGEVALCIYISGCQNRCIECHYPELQRVDYGD